MNQKKNGETPVDIFTLLSPTPDTIILETRQITFLAERRDP
jgi:hypothetical protein